MILICQVAAQNKDMLTPANHKHDGKYKIFPSFNFPFLNIKNTFKFLP